ncbi:hypothetical protein [Kitasatospora purpeofusca]|uniref:hypothetical protein n=1 Tax=Kitasatospora purpeofusca TaxID=67352 RepID=UPI0036A3FEAF
MTQEVDNADFLLQVEGALGEGRGKSTLAMPSGVGASRAVDEEQEWEVSLIDFPRGSREGVTREVGEVDFPRQVVGVRGCGRGR